MTKHLLQIFFVESLIPPTEYFIYYREFYDDLLELECFSPCPPNTKSSDIKNHLGFFLKIFSF